MTVSDIVLILFIFFIFGWMQFYMYDPSSHDKYLLNKISELQRDLSGLKSLETNYSHLLQKSSQYERKLTELEKTLTVTYIRHGHHGCPDSAQLLYRGFSAGARHNHGGGSNYLCLPKDPTWPKAATAGHQSQSYLHGVEYEHHNSPVMDKSKHNNDVPCAVCEAIGRSQRLMIPAKETCPQGWTKEFSGLLMASHHTHKISADFTCVDSAMQTVDGGHENKDGGVFYVVEAVCGSLQCPPYVNGYEIVCVMCTK